VSCASAFSDEQAFSPCGHLFGNPGAAAAEIVDAFAQVRAQ
jgi:hypothetical protein